MVHFPANRRLRKLAGLRISQAREVHCSSNWRYTTRITTRWHDQNYTAVVMHDLIKDRTPVLLSAIDRYLRIRFPKPKKRVMRRDTVAGKVMDVDFRYLCITYDLNTRRNRRTWVFFGPLRYSRQAWRERGFDQKQ